MKNRDDLWRYIENPTDPQLKRQIEATAVAPEAHSLLQLKSLLHRTTCPTAHELGEYYVGLSPRSRTRAIQEHVAHCPHCGRELVLYKQFMGEPERRLSPGEQIRVLVARLWEDVRGGGQLWTPALATRGEDGEESASAVYVIDEGIQIALQSQDDIHRAGHKLLTGLIINPPAETLVVHLWSAGQLLNTATVDGVGNFFFVGLGPGTYELIIQAESLLVHIPALPV